MFQYSLPTSGKYCSKSFRRCNSNLFLKFMEDVNETKHESSEDSFGVLFITYIMHIVNTEINFLGEIVCTDDKDR